MVGEVMRKQGVAAGPDLKFRAGFCCRQILVRRVTPDQFQDRLKGLQQLVNRLATDTVNNVIPAPGGKGVFSGTFTLRAIIGSQLQLRHQPAKN
jgi:hypothetical protein